MGTDKAWVELAGRPLVRHVLDRLALFTAERFVITKSPGPFERAGIPVFADEPGARTPISGIVTALRVARLPHVLVTGCDMPFISPELVGALIRLAPDADVVVPVKDGTDEVLHAVWHLRVLPELELAVLRDGERAVHRVLARLDAVRVPESVWRDWDPQGRSFFNINSPEDLARAAGLLSS